VTCKAKGALCTSGSECCSTVCQDPDGLGTAPATCTGGQFCTPAGGSCTTSGECCSLSCDPGTHLCASGSCKQQGQGCTQDGECCTGGCDPVAVGTTTKACAALPGGTQCKTLFDSCTITNATKGTNDCCSTVCTPRSAGALSGTCTPAYTCHATYDICYRNEECCTGLCDTSLGTPGRCYATTGSGAGACDQDGQPCTVNAKGNNNCCSQLCVPIGGGGVTVCQPAAGCRMTGDYCDRTTACCGGSPDAIRPAGYVITCDTGTTGTYRCDGGTACNPPGNSCGQTTSWNCCDGKKAVCKVDSNGIQRCFGGCPNDVCPANCPTGYTGELPCCIPAAEPENVTTANVCQFRDQCCGGAPCVPDANGVLHCVVSTCKPAGTACTGETDTSCCAPNSCLYVSGTTYQCGVDTTSCTGIGTSCSDGSTCCSKICVGSQCAACIPTGTACTANAQCCSATCDTTGTHTCVNACVPAGGTCTSASDCCAGITCNIPYGATSGTCGLTCAPNAYDPCSSATPCCSGTCYADPLHGNFAACPEGTSGCACSE
jgi:hypothetical protein